MMVEHRAVDEGWGRVSTGWRWWDVPMCRGRSVGGRGFSLNSLGFVLRPCVLGAPLSSQRGG